jgi:hypothetical protein
MTYLLRLNDIWVEEMLMLLIELLYNFFWLREEDKVVEMNGVHLLLVLLLVSDDRIIEECDDGRVVFQKESNRKEFRFLLHLARAFAH